MKKIICCLFLFLLMLLPFSVKASSKYLDYIEEYNITVDPVMEDGSLDIKIDIKWKVLDGVSEGPLTWVKIGVPNYHCNNIKALTNNIKNIRYYEDDGSFIRIDFYNSYGTGSIVDFSFSFNQSYMYQLKEGDAVYYNYAPGYFTDIWVGKEVLKWNAKDSISALNNNNNLVDGYYVYEFEDVAPNEQVLAEVVYDRAKFGELSKKKQYTDRAHPLIKDIIIVASIVLVVALFIYIVRKITKNSNPYMFERGYIGNRYYYWWYPHHYHYYNSGVSKTGAKIINPTSTYTGSGNGIGHGGCACACACACAGGGRAGCSMKDFYNTNLKSEQLKRILKSKNEES